VLLQVRLVGMEQLAPRETHSLGVAAKEVPAAYQALLAAVADAGGRVINSELNEKDRRSVTGMLAVEFLRADADKIDKALSAAGAVYTRSVTRSPDVQNTVDSKLRMNVQIVNVAQLPPRETGKLGVIVSDVAAAAQQAADAAVALGGRVTESRVSSDAAGQNTGTVVVDLPLRSAGQLRSAVAGLGERRVDETAINPASPDNEIGRARFEITLQSRDQIVGRDDGIAATLRRALQTSAKGLLVSLQVLVVGLLFVVPWAMLVYLGYRLVRRSRTRGEAGPTPSPAM
jgi:glycine cleavage system regulatory protein